MVRLLFLIPVLMCLGWYLYLRKNGWSVRQGWKGFACIIGFHTVIALCLFIIMLLTHSQTT